MYQKKITQVLRTFDEREWRACYKFLKYCNKREAQGLKVFEYIYKYRKELKSPKLQAGILREKILPTTSDRAFLNILSDLVKDVELFMMTDELQKKDRSYDQKKLMSEIYKSRGLFAFFERSTKEAIRILDDDLRVDLFDGLRKLQIHHSYFFSEIGQKNRRPVKYLKMAEKYRRSLSKSLQLYYEAEAHNLQSILKVKSTLNLEYEEDLIIQLLNHYKKLAIDRDDSSFQILERQILSDNVMISGELKQTFLLALLNHSIYKIKSGDISMRENMATLSIYGLNEGVLLNNNRLSETRFLNLVDVISKSDINMDRDEFVNRWIDKVVTKDKESIKNIARAMWAFAKERYQETLEILSGTNIHLTHLNLALAARWMEICALCSVYPDHQEKNEVLNAATSFFRRHEHEMNTHTYNGSRNLVQVVRLFWNQKDISEILEFTNQMDFIVFRSWIDKELKKITR